MKIFRKQRQQLAADNNVVKYLRYAIGEIVLVIIGILIALGINNWHQARVHDENTRYILLQMQDELETDIKNATALYLTFYTTAQNVRDYLRTGQLSAQNYKIVSSVLLYYHPYIIHDASYTRLMSNLENVPRKYRSLIDLMQQMYINDQNNIARLNSTYNKKVYDDINTLDALSPHMADWKTQGYPKAFYQFLNHYPYTENRIYSTMLLYVLLTGSVKQYRSGAIHLYKKIDSLLEIKPGKTPEFLREIGTNRNELQAYEGNYNMTTKDPTNAHRKHWSLKIKNNKLYWDLDNHNLLQLFWVNDTLYYPQDVNVDMVLGENRQHNKTVTIEASSVSVFVKSK